MFLCPVGFFILGYHRVAARLPSLVLSASRCAHRFCIDVFIVFIIYSGTTGVASITYRDLVLIGGLNSHSS